MFYENCFRKSCQIGLSAETLNLHGNALYHHFRMSNGFGIW